MKIRSRIAPTPSGFLHIGNAFSFLLTWLIVRKQDGFLQLRIDDLDAARLRNEYLDDIFLTLEWLKIDYDSGASGTVDFLKNFSQQNHIPNYEIMLKKLLDLGYIYACQCSRKNIREISQNGIYPKICKNKNIDLEQNTWRIALPQNCKIVINDFLETQKYDLSNLMGDFVVKRKDKIPAYQIASLCDDIENQINFIVRGEDLIASTAAQLFLAQILDFQSFNKNIFLHHPLFYDENNQKLSKSTGATALKEIRKNSSPSSIYQLLAHNLGLSKNITTIWDLLDNFEIDKIKNLTSLEHLQK